MMCFKWHRSGCDVLNNWLPGGKGGGVSAGDGCGILYSRLYNYNGVIIKRKTFFTTSVATLILSIEHWTKNMTKMHVLLYAVCDNFPVTWFCCQAFIYMTPSPSDNLTSMYIWGEGGGVTFSRDIWHRSMFPCWVCFEKSSGTKRFLRSRQLSNFDNCTCTNQRLHSGLA